MIDKYSQKEIENLLTPGQEEALIEAFLRPLAFGTGGLREKMGSQKKLYELLQ